MDDDRPVLASAEPPEAVLALVRGAVVGGLLDDVESLAAGLTAAGWHRGVPGGSWVCTAHPEWTGHSAGQHPGAGIFTQGGERLVRAAADRLGSLLDDGALGAVELGEPDPDWRIWTTGAVVVDLNTSAMTRPPWLRDADLPPEPWVLQLDLARADTPDEGPPQDDERSRRLAREGSPLQRWYLAAQEDLPDDVVAVLSLDPDPAVVAALDAGARQRAVFREHG